MTTCEVTTGAVRRRAMLPPEAPGLPLVGNAVEMARDVSSFLLRSYYELGPAFRIRILGREWTVLAGIKANRLLLRGAEGLLTSQPIYHRVTEEVGASNFLVGMDGDDHASYRRAVAPAFGRPLISQHVPRMVASVERAARAWAPGQRLRVRETLQRLVVEQTGAAMLNRPPGPHFDELKTFSRLSIAAGVAGWPRALLRLPAYRRARELTFRLVREAIAEHAREGTDRTRDTLDVLLGAIPGQGRRLEEAEVVAYAQMAYGSSIVYTSTACSFALYELLKHPELLERATEEVDAAFDGGTFDAQRIGALDLLRRALMESMRLHPIALMIPRHAEREFEFEGCRVEAGSRVYIATTMTHFLPELFPAPFEFDMERFTDPRNEHRTPGAYAPLGLGVHGCVGSGVVETVSLTVLATLLRTVRLVMDPPEYTIRKRMDPIPVPEDEFAVRVAAQR